MFSHSFFPFFSFISQGFSFILAIDKRVLYFDNDKFQVHLSTKTKKKSPRPGHFTMAT